MTDIVDILQQENTDSGLIEDSNHHPNPYKPVNNGDECRFNDEPFEYRVGDK